EDGTSYGTVGGGTLEAQTYEEALLAMNTHEARILKIDMNSAAVSDRGMICGGDVSVLLEPIATRYRDVYEKVWALTTDRQKGVIITGSENGVLTKGLIDSQDVITGDVPDPDTVIRFSKLMRTNRSLLVDSFFIENITIPNRLYIFGAGHVAEYLVKLAGIADFEVTVIDERKEFANHKRFPDAGEIVVAGVRDAFHCLDFTGDEYVVIMSWSHEQDSVILEKVLNHKARYVGMIGSKRKITAIKDRVQEKGISESLINSIYAPIGVPINAETPQEIAFSIVAELIKVKNDTDRALEKQ
ncbi:MAG TPA: XdhC family protein, partial [Syntrophorhabdaceae bacterium]|nr:XdhC family protein [Syntrophorhabdaceae bacterium]